MRPVRQQQNIVETRVSNKTRLSRLVITGHVYEHTPMCVLMEIADAHGIRYDQQDAEKPNFAQHLLASIHQTQVPSITEVKEIYEWEYVGRFVNKHTKWPQRKLTEAYNFLLGFMNNEDPLVKIPTTFIAGVQTPENPTAINACVLYKICMHHRLNVNSRTTLSQMAYAVRMIREGIESVVRRVKSFVEKDADRTNLINILMLSHHEIPDPDPEVIASPITYSIVPKADITHEVLQAMHASLTDVTALQRRVDPNTQSGAIALAALNFNIDISRATNPLIEYKRLKLLGRNDYRPSDPWMQYWYERNPSMFDLTITFNPLFPPGFYDPNRIIDMVRREGYSSEEIQQSDPYELLQLAYVTETFYQGEFPVMETTETPVELAEISEVPYGQLLSFGQPEFPMQPLTMTELIATFRQNQNFDTPFRDQRVFSEVAINKLKYIVESPSGPNPNIRLSPETIQIRATLLELINNIELVLRNNDEASRQFMSVYINASSEIKEEIRTALTSLLHLGMYMRGWIGSGLYPVEQSTVADSELPAIAVRVTDGVNKFERECRALGNIGTQLLNLPLVLYKDGVYNASTDEVDGLTIGDRIAIVKQGEDGAINTCIRLSSNWLCSSAHKYITCLGFPAPFNIFALRRIS